jgi:hypothetical protein
MRKLRIEMGRNKRGESSSRDPYLIGYQSIIENPYGKGTEKWELFNKGRKQRFEDLEAASLRELRDQNNRNRQAFSR